MYLLRLRVSLYNKLLQNQQFYHLVAGEYNVAIKYLSFFLLKKSRGSVGSLCMCAAHLLSLSLSPCVCVCVCASE